MRGSIIVHVIPPSQSDQQAPRYVLNRPEIGRQQKHDKHETRDERIAEPTA